MYEYAMNYERSRSSLDSCKHTQIEHKKIVRIEIVIEIIKFKLIFTKTYFYTLNDLIIIYAVIAKFDI